MSDDREEGGVDATPEGSARAGQRPKPRREGLASRAQRAEKALADFAKNFMRDYLGGEPLSGNPLIEINRRAFGALRQAPTVINPERPRPTTHGDIDMANSIERYKNPERSEDDEINTHISHQKQRRPESIHLRRPGSYLLERYRNYRIRDYEPGAKRFVEDQRTSHRARAYNELLRAARETLARPMPSPTHDRDSPDPEVVRAGMRTKDGTPRLPEYTEEENSARFNSMRGRGTFTLEDDLAGGVGGSQIVLAAVRDAIRRGDYPRAKKLLTEGYDMPYDPRIGYMRPARDGSGYEVVRDPDYPPTTLRLRIADGSRGSDDRLLAAALLRQVNNYLEQEAKKPRSSDMGGEADIPDDQE